MSGPFDDLTETQRRQIRKAHIADKRARAREGFWTAGGWMRLEDAPPEHDESCCMNGTPPTAGPHPDCPGKD